MENKIITVDGPAGSGKSTVSKLLAKALNFIYLDTGAMYRAVALQAERKGVKLGEVEQLRRLCDELDLNFLPDGEGSRIHIGHEDVSLAIRSPEMDMLSSRISAIEVVREAMTALQRKIGQRGSLVAEGRDMGTVVFPDADHKFFITASPEVRAERRYLERQKRGESVFRSEVTRELFKRDDQDTQRPIAPLQPAENAKVIDTTTLIPAQVVEVMMTTIKNRKD